MQVHKHSILGLAPLAAVALSVGLLGCYTPPPKPVATATPTATAPAEAQPLCGVPTGKKYSSVQQGVCDGKPCSWYITMRPAAGDTVEFSWYHNGQNRLGSCQCGGGDALSCRMNAAETFSAQWDAGKSVLQWGGEEYKIQ